MLKARFAKGIWLDLIQTPPWQEGRKERYKIERKFGEEQRHGLGRCRYLGLMGLRAQTTGA